MMKNVSYIILILIAIGLVYTYVLPGVDIVQDLQARESQYVDVLDNKTREFEEIRSALRDQIDLFSTLDRSRLERLLPTGIDTVRLIADIDSIAARSGLLPEGFNVGQEEDSAKVDLPASSTGKSVHTTKIGFSIEAPYSLFDVFVQDLEDSLQLFDIVRISVNSSLDGVHKFDVTLITYWLQ